jgi:hypothetical protein
MAGVRETRFSLPWLKKIIFGLPLLLGQNAGLKLIRWIYLKRSQKNEVVKRGREMNFIL